MKVSLKLFSVIVANILLLSLSSTVIWSFPFHVFHSSLRNGLIWIRELIFFFHIACLLVLAKLETRKITSLYYFNLDFAWFWEREWLKSNNLYIFFPTYFRNYHFCLWSTKTSSLIHHLQIHFNFIEFPCQTIIFTMRYTLLSFISIHTYSN